MKVVPVPLNEEQREQLSYGCIPSSMKFHLIFESQEEAEDVKDLLEHCLSGKQE